MTSLERRRYPRIDLPASPGLLDGRHPFEALTVSAGGMLIRLASEPPLDQQLGVELQLGEATFRAIARVVFTGPDLGAGDAGGERYRVGLAFVAAPSSDIELLDRFLAQQLAAAEEA